MLFARTCVLAAIFTLPACVEVDAPDGITDEETEAADLTRLPPPAYTTVTLYSEAGLWGTSQTVQLYRNDTGATVSDPAPGPNAQNVAVQSSLQNRVSSARITCGANATDVIFYDTGQNGSPGAAFSCRPGATVDVNFHTTPGYPGGLTLGDRIDGIRAFVRPDITNDYPLGQAVLGIWNDVHDQVVPSTDWYAPLAKDPYIFIYDSNWFLVGQEYNTFNATREAPITIHIYVHVTNDANGFRFQTALNYFTCTRATGGSSGTISCGTQVDQERAQLVSLLQWRLNNLANALPHTRSAYIYPTLGALDFGIGFVP